MCDFGTDCTDCGPRASSTRRELADNTVALATKGDEEATDESTGGGRCADYDPAVFDDTDPSSECPRDGSIICGTSEPVVPVNSPTISRPYRIGTESCAKGCRCDSPTRVKFEQCEDSYTYVGRCEAVYAVNSTESATKLQGEKLVWSRAALGSQVTQGVASVLTNQQIDGRYVTGEAADWTISDTDDQTRTYRTLGASERCVDDEGIFSLSMPAGASFDFLGRRYSVLYVSSNGYLCFDEAALTASVSVGTVDNHFQRDKKACFSFLLADLDPSSVHVAHVELRNDIAGTGKDTGAWAPYATYLTILDAPLKGALPTAVLNTVQVELNYMENSIAVTYGRIAPQITAVIGPSQGLGTPEGFVPRSLV